ncbi:hypothetical protein [Cyanobium sp. N5-Cardenillas]|uniref:hypothetical protein n=1 Tax=Cyanobium sp. N5-Cardenillas TaxID=2823720 RepID=UPI0020CE3FFD|nr:hypothetical protein [Cyanobium sp. N5-Cardenillas]MCP9785392.1 hypothetical protein [Cyanobium sp. N5-Cardenillas]
MAPHDYLTIAAIVYAAASEIIGMSPLKDHSVIQLVLRILGMLLAQFKPKANAPK